MQVKLARGMTAAPEMVPLEASQILLVELGPLAFQQFQYPRGVVRLPGLHGEAHLAGVKAVAGQQLLLLGRFFVRNGDAVLGLGFPGVVAHPLKNFWCPSAPEQDRYYAALPFAAYSGKGACGDYAPTWFVDPALATGDNQGVLAPNHMTRLTDIQDGASNTILLAEDAGRPRLWQAGRAGPPQAVSGGPWAGFDTGITLKGSTPDGAQRPGPCALNCTNDHEVYSFHPGGANAVFADDSVHFLHAGMNIRILAALITRAGREDVSGNDY